MKKTIYFIVLVACMTTLIACTKSANNLADLDDNSINKIQVISSMGNPLYGADSKIITDEQEIKSFIKTFNSGTIGEKISADEVLIGFSSRYIFSKDDEMITEYYFNTNNTKVVMIENEYYDVDYGDEDSPYTLYESSKSTEIVVDMDGKEMDLIRYNENTYVKSELDKETVQWLETYNSLTDDEKLSLSYVPDLGEPFNSDK